MLQVKSDEVYEAAFRKESEMFYEFLQQESLNFFSFQILLAGGCLSGPEGWVKIFCDSKKICESEKKVRCTGNNCTFKDTS